MADTTTFLSMSGKPIQINGWFFNRDYWKKPLTLTLCASNGGTLTADTITGFPGDTIELAPTYDTYWRLSGYDVYGDGSISDNTYTFGSDDEQIVSAYFKPNAFTATGTFNWSDWTQHNGRKNAAAKSYNAVLKAFTGSKPSNWPAVNGNWNVTNASSYGIVANSKIRCRNTTTAYGGYNYASGVILIAGSRKAGLTSAYSLINYTTAWSAMFTLNMSKQTSQGQLTWSGYFYNTKPNQR